jgi:ABC-type Na+ efflux pump permease subunit
MAGSALAAASGVAGERARGTWDGLLVTPIDRGSILRAKMWGAVWSVRTLLGMIVLLDLASLAATAMHPAGLVLGVVSLAAFIWFAVAVGTSVSARIGDPGRAIARTAVILVAVDLAPVAALGPFVGWQAASLAAAPRLLLELPMSRMRVLHFTKAMGIEPVAVRVVLGMALGIVAAHALAAGLLTRAAARQIARSSDGTGPRSGRGPRLE